ncbi:MAG: HAD hydrolase family protein [Oceanococcaceae bacterium]
MSAIRLLVLDVDGVLTDGKLYIGPDGQQWRSSHVRDGLGIKKLIAAGIEPVIISGRPAGGMAERMAALGIREQLWGHDDKWPALEPLLARRDITPAQVAAMGDDEPDLALMDRVGLGLCPADAIPAVRARADFIADSAGGQGAVREAAEWLLEHHRP